MVLQLQRDPKTGNLMMLNNQAIRPQTVIQMENQGGPVAGQQQGQQVANHGYHPGRHLHHQLQLKHLPQVTHNIFHQMIELCVGLARALSLKLFYKKMKNFWLEIWAQVLRWRENSVNEFVV